MSAKAPDTMCDILSDVENIRRCFHRRLSVCPSVCMSGLYQDVQTLHKYVIIRHIYCEISHRYADAVAVWHNNLLVRDNCADRVDYSCQTLQRAVKNYRGRRKASWQHHHHRHTRCHRQ